MDPSPARDRLSDLYHRALACTPEQRSTFLDEECKGDAALRGELESLLRYEADSARFLETPAAVAGSDLARAPDRSQMTGRQLGPYAIVAPLGAGGMGEVYRARDSKLGRDVAIKILPSHFTSDPERRVRFAREARLLATLSHPNIGAIYGLEETDGLTALVLELVEGPTLADRIARGPLPLAEALAIARQIAEALDAAHEKGIVHRDLKPANIVLQATSSSREVRAKILDFGLAKGLTDPKAVASVTVQSTEDGRILGTPGYMSPEQARGQTVDKRTDIWAFGCVLYEMLTERQAFAGDTVSDTLVCVLEREPDWAALPSATPGNIRSLLERCLRKDAQRRLPDIADARVELEEYAAVTTAISSPVLRRLRNRAIVVGATLLAFGSAAAVWILGRPDQPAELSSATRQTFDDGLQTDPSFSPEGREIAYASSQSGNFDIWRKSLGPGDAIQVTRDPAHDWQPDWSPDGNHIVFRSERNGGGLYLVPSSGGHERQLTSFGYLPQWSPDGSKVLFVGSQAAFAAVYTIGKDDREPVRVDTQNLQTEVHPGLVGTGWHPDSRQLIFLTIRGAVLKVTLFDIERGTIGRSRVGDSVQQRLRDLGLYTNQRDPQLLSAIQEGAQLYFSAFSKERQSVWRLDIDARTLAVTGGPHEVTSMSEDVRRLRLSRDGQHLAFDAAHYRRAHIKSYPLDDSGRKIAGAPVRLTPESKHAFSPDLTRDGTTLAFMGEDLGSVRHVHELRVYSLLEGSSRVLSTDDLARGESRGYLRWSPDGGRLAYRLIREGFSSIQILDVRGGEERPLTSSVDMPRREIPYGWSAEGDMVIASSLRHGTNRHAIVMLPVSKAPNAETGAITVTDSADFYLWNPSMSPDGQWILFQAAAPGPAAAPNPLTASGTRNFSRKSKIAIVSSRGGPWIEITDGAFWDDKPRWSADGRLLYFVSDRGGLFNVWARAFDPLKGEPVGVPFAVTQFTGLGEQTVLDFRTTELAVGGGRLAIPIINSTGGIWMLDNLQR